MSAYNKTLKGNYSIPYDSLILLSEAERIKNEIGALSVQEYVNPNPDEVIVYSDGENRRLYQIIGQDGELQDAAKLQAAQQSGSGSWDTSDPGNTRWVLNLNRPADTASGAVNVDFMAMAAKPELEHRAEVLRLLNAILAK